MGHTGGIWFMARRDETPHWPTAPPWPLHDRGRTPLRVRQIGEAEDLFRARGTDFLVWTAENPDGLDRHRYMSARWQLLVSEMGHAATTPVVVGGMFLRK